MAAFAPDKGESVNTLIKDTPPGAPVPPILPRQNGYLFLDKAPRHGRAHHEGRRERERPRLKVRSAAARPTFCPAAASSRTVPFLAHQEGRDTEGFPGRDGRAPGHPPPPHLRRSPCALPLLEAAPGLLLGAQEVTA